MALDTYTNLQAALASWAGRSDLTSVIPDCITMAESKMNRYLRTKDMVGHVFDFGVVNSFMPADFGGVKSFVMNLSSTHISSVPDYALEYMPDDKMASYGNCTGKPKFYNVSGGRFNFSPTPDSDYLATLTYYVKIAALSGSNASNWVLTSHPDAYMYGAMGEICGYLRDPVGAKTWETAMYSILDEIQGISAKDQAGGSMAVRVA
jgi:hypothetical protein